jgi:hypothetical protein
VAARGGIERRVVREVDVSSVVRVAFALGLALGAVLLIGFVALYLLGLASGGVGGVERFFESLGYDDFSLNVVAVLAVFIVVAAIFTALLTGLAAAMAVLYNALADLIGGVEITTRERPGR